MFSMPVGLIDAPMDWLVILLVGLLLFGSRMPSVMRNLGRSVNEFKKGLNESAEEISTAGKEGQGAKSQSPEGQAPHPVG